MDPEATAIVLPERLTPSAFRLGRRIEILRKDTGIPRQQFTKCVGIEFNMYQHYISGHDVPSLECLREVAKLGGVTVEMMLGDQPMRVPDETLPIHMDPLRYSPPPGGWKPNTLYKVKVALYRHNAPHHAYLMVGFLSNNAIPHPTDPVWNYTYDRIYHWAELYSIEFIRVLDTEGAGHSDKESTS